MNNRRLYRLCKLYLALNERVNDLKDLWNAQFIFVDYFDEKLLAGVKSYLSFSKDRFYETSIKLAIQWSEFEDLECPFSEDNEAQNNLCESFIKKYEFNADIEKSLRVKTESKNNNKRKI